MCLLLCYCRVRPSLCTASFLFLIQCYTTFGPCHLVGAFVRSLLFLFFFLFRLLLCFCWFSFCVNIFALFEKKNKKLSLEII